MTAPTLPRPRGLASPGAPHRPGTPTGGASLRWVDGEPLVMLTGDVDVLSARRVAAAGWLLRRWSPRAVVDASCVGFIDIAGLRALLALAGDGGELLVLRPSRPLLRLLAVLSEAQAGLLLAPEPGRADALTIAVGDGPW